VFSLCFLGETYRVMLRLVARPQLDSQTYGLLGYCHRCGDCKTVSWRNLGRTNCAHDGHWLTISGAMWLRALHNSKQLHKLASLADQWQWSKQSTLLNTIGGKESDLPPYFYTLGEINPNAAGCMDILSDRT
jgi:tRNA (guanine26-N2/guanine27-N2)-dimethyltransferase